MPFTGFESKMDNPIEKIFMGRLRIESAAACLFFNTGSITQQLIHHIKYHNEPELAVELGNIIGQKLLLSKRFTEIDAIIPLPLFKTRERKRGYNQAERLAKGVAEVLQKPLWNDLIKRNRSTATQTKKTRSERWENVEGIFTISSRREIKDLHLLVVDDVITTGATLEACAASLREQGAKISISTLAYAMK
jgi:ComF family protein